jgi:putative salt-induced outer membrane protein YdiY
MITTHRQDMRICTVLVLGLLGPPVAAAQTFVPPAPAPIVESRPLPPLETLPTPDRWSGKGEVSYVSTGGNTETTTAKLGGEIQYRPADWTLLFRVAYLTSTSQTGDRNERVDGLLRASRPIGRRLELYGQIVYLQNTFAGITSSIYPLGGLSYAIIESGHHTLSARGGLGFGQENRVRTVSTGFATADTELTYRWRLSQTAELRQETTVTANLDRAADWRAAGATAISAGLNALLSLKLSHIVSYFNEPVAGFERVDTISSAAVVATF